MWEEVRDENGRLLFKINRAEALIETVQTWWCYETRKKRKRFVITNLSHFFPMIQIHALSIDRNAPQSACTITDNQGARE
jgi:hypothetical protein